MKMSNEKKKESLLNNFEIIKSNYEENDGSIADVVVMMFGIDVDIAVDMWKYLLQTYEDEVKGSGSYSLTGRIAYGGSHIVGESSMEKIILDNPTIKRSMFSYMCDNPAVWVGDIIQNNITKNNLLVANELLELDRVQ